MEILLNKVVEILVIYLRMNQGHLELDKSKQYFYKLVVTGSVFDFINQKTEG